MQGSARQELATRAEEAGSIHERLTAHDRAASVTWLTGSPVGVEGSVEGAGFAVHVDVEGVETRAPLGQGVGHHRADVREHLPELGCADAARRSAAMQFAAPQGFVGIDVAYPGNQRLVQEGSLDLGVFVAGAGDECVVVELWVKWVSGDVGGDGRDASVGIVWDEFIDGEPSEGTLIDETQFGLPCCEGHAHTQVGTRVLIRTLQEQLAAHAEMCDEGMGVVTQWQPQELAAPTHRHEGAVQEMRGKWHVRATHRSGMTHLDLRDALIEDVGGQTATNGFDLRQFRHR